jgi:excisionase family DNA binding protein
MGKHDNPTQQSLPADAGTLRVADLAALLKCSEKNVRRKLKAREIPGVIRLGRLIRFSKPVIAEWLGKATN